MLVSLGNLERLSWESAMPREDKPVGWICGDDGCGVIMASEFDQMSKLVRDHGVLRSVAAVWMDLERQLQNHDARARGRGYECCECDLCNMLEREMERLIPGSVGPDAGEKRPQEFWRLPCTS